MGTISFSYIFFISGRNIRASRITPLDAQSSLILWEAISTNWASLKYIPASPQRGFAATIE
jgi:hypothetical protein